MAFFYKYEYTNKRKNIHPWLEEDFNGRKTLSYNSRKTVEKHGKTAENIRKHLKSSDIILGTTEDPS